MCAADRSAGDRGFDGLVNVVGHPPDSRTPEPAEDRILAEKLGEEAILRRKKLVIKAGTKGTGFQADAADPKHQFPVVLCRLCQDEEDHSPLDYLPLGMKFREQGDTFGKSSLSRVFCQFGERLSEETAELVFKEVSSYEGFLGGGTENHVTMRRTAGFLFGERFPDADLHFGLTGRELAGECLDYMKRYGRAIYGNSMVEYLSPIYHAVHTAAWLNVADFAIDPRAKLSARAILDWMLADLAVNNHHGIILPPVQRAKGFMTNSYMLSRSRTHTQWTAWLYWGAGTTPATNEAFESPDYWVEKPYGMCAMLHAVSDYVPHPVIRNLGAKRVSTPYKLLQSRVNWEVVEPAQINAYGKTGMAHKNAPNSRYHMRSAYVDRQYAVGAGYRHAEIMDPIVRHAIPFSVVWQSRSPRNWLFVSHPYWYTARKRDDSDVPIGEDDWSGVSPFCQMVHWENATVLIFDIPETDPYAGKAGKGSPDWLSERTEALIQKVHIYVPEAIDEATDTAKGVFVRAGDVYIGIRPAGGRFYWEKGGHPGYKRLVIAGPLVTVAIEVGDNAEFGSFGQFREKVTSALLDDSALQTNKRVCYHSTRGHRLDLQHNYEEWVPIASVNDVELDFDRWPTCESPYLTCRDNVLDVNDGGEGFRIDWRGEFPEYTYYALEQGQRRITRRERIVDGQLAIEELT